MLLATYLTKRGMGHSQFAREIGVSAEAVRRYAVGDRVPRPAVMTRIVTATHGKVTPNDFFRSKAEASQ